MTTAATQLTITVPEGVVPGSILQVAVKSSKEKVRVRVPAHMSAGSKLVLTKVEGSDEWIEDESSDAWRMAGSMVRRGQSPVEAPPVVRSPQNTVPPPIPTGPVAYTVRLDTTVGIIDIIVRPDWAPQGARRFLDLAAIGDLDNLAFYRSVKGCLVQFGLPAKRPWPPLPDDPRTGVPFLLGAVCFAAVGPNARKSTVFICTGDMTHCFGEQAWQTPIGAVAESSLDVLDLVETVYGDIAECGGTGPDTSRINAEGSAYLRSDFPLLTFIRSAWPLDWQPPTNGQEAEQGQAGTHLQQLVRCAEESRVPGQLLPAPVVAESPTHAQNVDTTVVSNTTALIQRLEDQDQANQAAMKEMERKRQLFSAPIVAESRTQAQNVDTTALLKRLEDQDQAHRAAMKDMERKLLEVTETAQRLKSGSHSKTDSTSSGMHAAGSVIRASLSPRTTVRERSREPSPRTPRTREPSPAVVGPRTVSSPRSVSVPVKVEEEQSSTLNKVPFKTSGVGVPVETLSSLPSPPNATIVDVPVQVARTSRKSLRGSREVQVEVESPRGRNAAPQSPMGQHSENMEVSFSDGHSVLHESSIRFAPPEFSRYSDHPMYGAFAPPSSVHISQAPPVHVQPGHLDRSGSFPPHQWSPGMQAPHLGSTSTSQSHHIGTIPGPMMPNYTDFGASYSQQHSAFAPPVQPPVQLRGTATFGGPPMNMHINGDPYAHHHLAPPPPAQNPQMAARPNPHSWQCNPQFPNIPQQPLSSSGYQSPRMPGSRSITEVAAAGVAALAPSSFSTGPPPFQPTGPPPFGHMGFP